jgi:chorismate-pyruvate lyase
MMEYWNNGIMGKIRLIWQSWRLTQEVIDKGCRRQLTRLLRMRQSTTKFLEELSGQKLQVKAEFQKEIFDDGEVEIVRLSRLFFDGPENSIILSISSFLCKNLSEREMEQVKSRNIPLGKIFGSIDMNGLKKTDICIKRVVDERLARKLNVRAPRCFSKEYALWTGARQVGIVKEIFSEESFLRVWR